MVCVGFVLAISACAGDRGDDQGRASVVLFERAVTCEVPAPGFVAEIEQRLIVVGGFLRGAHTARSNETTWAGEGEVWFPTVIEGPGFEGLGDVAVWATVRDRRWIEPVNHLARVFSTLGSDSPFFALDYEEDALTAAVDCVEISLRTSARSR